MPHSVLEAIRLGNWDFEPNDVASEDYESTEAVPGSSEKLAILADRIRRGLPLWHRGDRRDFENMPSSDGNQ